MYETSIQYTRILKKIMIFETYPKQNFFPPVKKDSIEKLRWPCNQKDRIGQHKLLVN